MLKREPIKNPDDFGVRAATSFLDLGNKGFKAARYVSNLFKKKKKSYSTTKDTQGNTINF